MIKYREHRGSLDVSLSTNKGFNTLTELFQYLDIDLSHISELTNKKNITVRYYGFDERCNQELFIVSVEDCGVLGFIY